MSDNSIRRLLGLAITALIIESPLIQTAHAAETVALFKVVTTKDEIVIGFNDGELAQLESKDAGGIAKLLVGKGSISVWQYAVRKNASGDLEQAPLRKIALISNDSLRIEPYSTPLKIVPLEEATK
jgi:hypothetical protein